MDHRKLQTAGQCAKPCAAAGFGQPATALTPSIECRLMYRQASTATAVTGSILDCRRAVTTSHPPRRHTLAPAAHWRHFQGGTLQLPLATRVSYPRRHRPPAVQLL